jgi:hypothetical protein
LRPSFAQASGSRGAEDENLSGATQGVFGGPQASSDEDTNLALDQDKPQCIKPPSLRFVCLYILIMILDCALGCRTLIDTLVALCLLSDLSLLIIWLEIGHYIWLGIAIGYGYGRWPSGRKTTWRL